MLILKFIVSVMCVFNSGCESMCNVCGYVYGCVHPMFVVCMYACEWLCLIGNGLCGCASVVSPMPMMDRFWGHISSHLHVVDPVSRDFTSPSQEELSIYCFLTYLKHNINFEILKCFFNNIFIILKNCKTKIIK